MIPFGPYTLLSRLAVGGMSEVFVAIRGQLRGHDPADAAAPDDELIIVKRILPHLEQRADFVQMFVDEARVASRLFHDNLVQILDFGRAEGTHFIAMEYVDGLSLCRLLSQLPDHRLDVELACWLVDQAAAGLAYVHARTDAQGRPLNIVHRDISPDNLLLSRDGAVKLADFGIAKATIQLTHTRPGQLKGKVCYMSPEQADPALEVDRRSDIFSLGLVLYELTTGRRVFNTNNDLDALRSLMRVDYPAPDQLVAGYPRALSAIIDRTLQQHPDDRFQCADDLRDALRALLPSQTRPAIDLGELVQRHAPPTPSATPELGRATVRAPTIDDDSEDTARTPVPVEVVVANTGEWPQRADSPLTDSVDARPSAADDPLATTVKMTALSSDTEHDADFARVPHPVTSHPLMPHEVTPHGVSDDTLPNGVATELREAPLALHRPRSTDDRDDLTATTLEPDVDDPWPTLDRRQLRAIEGFPWGWIVLAVIAVVALIVAIAL